MLIDMEGGKTMTEATIAPRDAVVAGDWQTAAAQNLAEAWLTPAEAQGQRTQREATVWLADSDLPHPFMHSATLLAPLGEGDAAECIARLRRFYAAGTGDSWALWSAWPTPDLRPFGGIFVGQPPLMVRPAGPIPPAPPELAIREVTDAAALVDFERTFIEGYPIPELQPFQAGRLFTPPVLGGDYRLWLGYAEGRPVTCAIAQVSAGVVGVHLVATLPEARGRGYGAAITARATSTAPDLPAVLQASDLGRPVYERIGFRVHSRFDLWIFPATAD
ncbi:MAG: GNAT family N-acetyltransferase [Thermomicrobiales bacterium]